MVHHKHHKINKIKPGKKIKGTLAQVMLHEKSRRMENN
jgi:retron-type reverse transcriptase